MKNHIRMFSERGCTYMGTPVLSRKADWRIDLSDRPELGMIDLDNGTPVLKIGIGQIA